MDKNKCFKTLLTICFAFVFFQADAQVKITENAVDQSAGNVSCYKIETPVAIYYLEKKGAGLSGLIDKDGNDWISFHKKEGTGAGGEYRGFPNAIHQQDGSFFHPINSGTDPSTTEITFKSPEKVTIKAISENNNWEGRWDFYSDHCTFTMTKMPAGYKYWILYEGTPGGSYDDDDWYFTSDIKNKIPLTENYERDIPSPEWIAFGDPQMERALFLVHHTDDDYKDKFYQMNKQMTVFGFGRDGMTKFLSTVPQSFSIGLIETDRHRKIRRKIRKIIKSISK